MLASSTGTILSQEGHDVTCFLESHRTGGVFQALNVTRESRNPSHLTSPLALETMGTMGTTPGVPA